MGILKSVTAEGVKDARTFARYAQQELGTPVPSNPKQFAQLGVVSKKAFEANPALTWESMVKVVSYCKNRKQRPYSAAAIFGQVRFAWSSGYLPELDPRQVETQDPRIGAALHLETDPEWRRKLATTTGEISTRVYEAWKEHRLAEV